MDKENMKKESDIKPVIDVLSVSLEEAKMGMIDMINCIKKEDSIKMTTKWVKDNNSDRCIKGIVIEIYKPGYKRELG